MAATRPAFVSEAAFVRGQRHLLTQLVCFGRHTISGLLRAQNRHQQSWTADYRLYAHTRFDPTGLFAPVRQQIEQTLAPDAPLVVAMDDSLLRKTGRKIHGVHYQRDPMSPPFHVNFVRGLRVLQLSAAVPQTQGAARLIPIDFLHAALPAKPPKKATEAEQQTYQQLRAEANLNRRGLERLKQLRQQMDPQRQLIVTLDGRFTNSTLLKGLPERTTVIGRVRKDGVLFYPPTEQPAGSGRKRKYGEPAPSPETLLRDEGVPWQTVKAFAAGKEHDFQVKRIGPVVARMDGAAHPMQLVVIKPLGYRLTQGGKLLYRQPAFLLCSDPALDLAALVQDFLWRWDIEVNFRDEKTVLGVGQAQVRSEASNQHAPALAVAAYALLLLAGIKTYGVDGAPDRTHHPKWYPRKKQQRATTNELINQLRAELWASSLSLSHFLDFSTGTPPDQKSEKSEPVLASSILLSMR